MNQLKDNKRVWVGIAVLAVVACAVCCAGRLLAFLSSAAGLVTVALVLVAAGVSLAVARGHRTVREQKVAAGSEKRDEVQATVDAS